MATGKSSYFDLDCSSTLFKVRVNWSETYDASSNTSVVTIDSVQFKSTGWYGFTYYPDGLVKINGETVITMNSRSGTHNCRASKLDAWANINKSGGELQTGSATVVHNADGKKSITIELVGNNDSKVYFYVVGNEQKGGAPWYVIGSSTITLTDIPTYTLSVSAGTGSTITVNRTSSGYSGAGTGNIQNGARLYYGDKLKITFAATTNYRLLTTKVNDTSFTSGNTHTVASNVSVTSTAQVLASTVGATDANIGSTSTITVTKFNQNYYHSLYYSFGGSTGYITSAGEVQSSEVKFKTTSIPFKVPTSFYTKIPNAKTGTCTITCRTYETSSSTTVLGTATTCTFTVTAANENCKPIVSALVEDTNPITCALTGNKNTLIRYRSTAKCTISASQRWSATIKSLSIAGQLVTGTESTDGQTGSAVFSSVDKTSFAFSATDSRGYTTTTTVSPQVVAYIVLTCNPVISRPTPTGSTMTLQITGNVYRGSFGAYSNTLTVQYRYKEDGGSYGSWKTIDPTKIVFGTSNYRTNGPVVLEDEFDYQKSYVFQVKAIDGANGYILSTAQSNVNVQRGIPVFDWGENDFNINVALLLNNVNIMDLMYPVGSVYMHSRSTMPPEISNIGDWATVHVEITGVYAWKRLA